MSDNNGSADSDHRRDIGLRGQRTQGRKDEEQVRFVLVVFALFAIQRMNLNDGIVNVRESDDNINDVENNEDDVDGDEIYFSADENNDDNINGDENNNDNVNDRVLQCDLENDDEPVFNPCDMSAYGIFQFAHLVLYVIVSMLMLFSLIEYVAQGIFNGNGYNFFLLIIGAVGSLLGTVLPTFIRTKFYEHLYGGTWQGFVWRLALMVVDIILFVLTTLGAVRVIRCLKGRASLVPLGFNLAAAIVLRVTQLIDADHGYTDMLIALFVGKIDEEYKHFRHRDLLVNISAIGWISIRIIGMTVMSEMKGQKNVKINFIIKKLEKCVQVLEARLTDSVENRRIRTLMSERLDLLKRTLKDD